MRFRLLSGLLLCAIALSSASACRAAPHVPCPAALLTPEVLLLPAPSCLLQSDSRLPLPLNTVYDVPYRLSETSHILVRAKINGYGPFTFIMDSGAPAIYLAKPIATRCGVTANREGWGVLNRLEIEGGLLLRKMPARVEEPAQLMGLNALGLSSDHIDGVLGYNLLSLFRIQLDLTQSKMVWTRTVEMPTEPESAPSAVDGAEKTPSFKRALKGVNQMTSVIQTASALFAQPHAPISVPRGFVGLVLTDSTEGPRIQRVLLESPAARAGLMANDLVLKVAPPNVPATEVHNAASVVHAAGGVRAGDHVVFVIRRGTRRIKIGVIAGKEGL